jgi:hypothetical protein
MKFRTREWDAALQCFEQLNNLYDTYGDVDGGDAFSALCALTQVHTYRGSLQEAERLIVELQRRADRRYGEDTPANWKMSILMRWAELRTMQGEIQFAMELLRAALEPSISWGGSDNGWTLWIETQIDRLERLVPQEVSDAVEH